MLQEKWQDEDIEDVKDNWDDEDEEEEHQGTQQTATATKESKKKALERKLAEREEKERKKREERLDKLRAKELANRKLTPEEQLVEKLERQRLQRESDLKVSEEMFGSLQAAGPEVTGLDTAVLTSKQALEQFRALLVQKLSGCRMSTAYTGFLEDLFRDLSAPLDVDDLKRLSSSLTALYNEKLKAQKQTSQKNKKKGKGVSLKMEKNTMFDTNDIGQDALDDEYDDFM